MESYFVHGKDCGYLGHSALRADRPTILILHGLGDSSLSYHAFFSEKLLENYNILIPDLLGYGKSSSCGDYRFATQIDFIIKHVNYLAQQFNIDFSNIFLLSHSMGGILGALLCYSVLKNKIAGFINVEGSVTQYGAFISSQVAKAVEDNYFDSWFVEFKDKIYLDFGNKFATYRQYYASLLFCAEEAFKQNGLRCIGWLMNCEGGNIRMLLGINI